ncbi:MAG: flagellar basal body L-ring protein FlgH [Deltaproteobacteria bacterium]|nr:MAG: flagellar basal body L-ring protein FlgH [Deltaproteobacteria bacterium]
MKHFRVTCGLATFFLLGACGPAHIAEYQPKRRHYEMDVDVEAGQVEPAKGSLYRGGNLFVDHRAWRPGDILVIEVEEEADAQRGADTSLSRDSKTEAAIQSFLGLVGRLQAAGVDPSLAVRSSSSFSGGGETRRSERLTATVPATVRKILPSGNLFVEGHRVVLVNEEEQHFYISGVVRPIDIDQNNSVKSTRVADAEIEFTGRGVLTDTQRQGFFARYFGWLWPF